MTVLDNVMVGRHCRTRTGFLANALRLPRRGAGRARCGRQARELVRFLGL